MKKNIILIIIMVGLILLTTIPIYRSNNIGVEFTSKNSDNKRVTTENLTNDELIIEDSQIPLGTISDNSKYTGIDIEKITLSSTDEVSIEEFGAVGDGKTDDSVAIQNAISYINNIGGGTIYLSNKIYSISPNILLKSNVNIIGDNTVLLVQSSDKYGSVFYSQDVSGLSNISISGIKIKSTNDKSRINGRSGLGSNILGIQLAFSDGVNISDMSFENLEYGIKFDKANNKNINLTNLSSVGTYHPIIIGKAEKVRGNHFVFDTNVITDRLDHGIYITTGANDVVIDDITIVGGAAYAIQVATTQKDAPATNITMSKIVLKDVGGGIVTTGYSTDCKFSQIEGSISNDTGTWFASFGDSQVEFSEFEVTGGERLFSAIGYKGSGNKAVIKNGTVGQTSNAYFSLAGIDSLTVSDVTFLNGTPKNGERLLYVKETSYLNQLEFVNNNVTFITTPKEPISIRNDAIANIKNNTFVNSSSTIAKCLVYNASGGSNVLIENNAYSGFNDITYNESYKTKGNMQIKK